MERDLESKKNEDDNFPKATIIPSLGKSFYAPAEPDSIRCSFRPLGLFAKALGLFPCYDLGFVEKMETNKVRLIHVLDYMYTTLMCLSLTGGALLCSIRPPKIMKSMKEASEDETDYYVQIVVFYLSIANGLMSMFIFPTSWCQLLNYVEHFGSIDKILTFDRKMEEKKFGVMLLLCVVVIMILTFVCYTFIYIMELPENEICLSDYVIVPVSTLATVILLIPTAIFVFFINAIRIRIVQLNWKMKKLLLPYTPCCFACNSFDDYASEMDNPTLYKKSCDLVHDLEKMRLLHEEISTLTLETSDIFGSHLIRECLHSVLGIVLYTYVLLFANHDHLLYRSFYIALDIFVICKLLVIATFCTYITSESEALRKMLNKTSMARLSPESNLQVQVFIKKLDTPIQITAAGFFVINRQLITSILGAITTYFIILIQFKVGEKKLSANSTCLIIPTELAPASTPESLPYLYTAPQQTI